VALGPAAAHGLRLAHARHDESLLLEADERLVNRAERQVALGDAPDGCLNRDAVSKAVQSQGGEHHNLLEIAEHVASFR
jgi:hypothetical protein